MDNHCISLIGRSFLTVFTIGALVVTALTSCSDEDIPSAYTEDNPITFSFIQQEEHTETRAASPLKHNFYAWGYKSFATAPTQKVFQGYLVTYTAGTEGSSADNTNGYSYVDPGHNQDVKYWDFAAKEYNFWGYTGNKSDFSADGTMLTISNLAQSVTEPAVTDKLFSALYHREPVSSEVVKLQFKRPYAKVRVMFYCSEKIDEGDKIEIGESTFGPESPDKIITEGKLKVTYSQSGNVSEKYETTPTSTADHLSFNAVDLTHEIGTASNKAATAKPAAGSDYYYVIPYDYNQAFTLSTTIDDEEKTTTLPKEFMNWKPNFVYTYIFKITEAGKKIEFYDVMIEPWKYGGSQEEEWKNW